MSIAGWRPSSSQAFDLAGGGRTVITGLVLGLTLLVLGARADAQPVKLEPDTVRPAMFVPISDVRSRHRPSSRAGSREPSTVMSRS